MAYKCVATGIPGFIQQLAVSYLRHGYWFYVTGLIPEHKNPEAVDVKLQHRYTIDIPPWERSRRKKKGEAGVHYLRHERFFVLLARYGPHRFFLEEKCIKDARRVPIKYGGYSVSIRYSSKTKRWHPSVRIERQEYLALTSFFAKEALRRSPEKIEELFESLRYEGYVPVRKQLLVLRRSVEKLIKVRGVSLAPWRPPRRRSVRHAANGSLTVRAHQGDARELEEQAASVHELEAEIAARHSEGAVGNESKRKDKEN